MSTNYLVCYDISEDDVRTTVAQICLSAGLVRIQYSVFYGKLSRDQVKELKLKVRGEIKDSNADVHFIKVCASCEQDHEVLLAINLKHNSYTDEVSYEEVSEEIEYDGGVMVL